MSKTLRQFLHESGPGSMSRLARDSGVSIQYICDITKGRKGQIGTDIAKRLEAGTKRKVKAAVIIGLVEPKISDDEYFAALEDG